MGRRGPKPTPTKILEARGSWRAGTRGNEPEPEIGAPRCPSWLNADGKRVWRALVPELVELGVFAHIDANAFARYCDVLARWRACQAHIEKNGDVFEVKNAAGYVVDMKAFPQTKLYLKLSDQLNRLEAQFGLNPSARASLEVHGDGNKTRNAEPAQIFELRG